ncbi:MAG: hypothetical protein NTY38_19275, partial [Acidobacteria bacterium]|nr:hypothetical protein [Acidobacteriota bacterium]
VENCNITSLDDGICLKGYTSAGCRNVVIRNNRVRSLCNGIKAGTDSSGGFQNILIENNVVWETGIAGIALELVDGGLLRNVIVRDIQMDVVGTPIFIKLGDRNRPIATEAGPVKPGMGTLEDVHISGIRATVKLLRKFNAEERGIYNLNTHASSITGIPGRYVERVYIRDVDIEIIESVPAGTSEDVLRTVPENSTSYPENRMFGTLPAHAFYLRHARDIHLSGIRTSIRRQDPRPAFILDDVQESSFLDVRSTGPAPFTPYVIGKNCSGVKFTPAP